VGRVCCSVPPIPVAQPGSEHCPGLSSTAAARLLGVDDRLGTVEVGKLADLVMIAGNPYDFEDVGIRIDQVWEAGQRVV
jgi:imidazolonepropionase-like amidohydrolase